MTSTKIRILSEITINKIAAGEVIENPASVVKELVENALDAESTDICVEIKVGGRHLIRVTDNGCGMSKDDALLSLERHATSKMREIEDIYQLQTMGFRGEALPSIAAISKLTLLTAHQGEGTLIIVEGGKILSCTAANTVPGTTIEVKSLFFNVPVRKKFQKSPTFDTQDILKMISLLALAYPHIQFELIADGKTLLKTPFQSSNHFQEQLSQRIDTVLGHDFFHQLQPVHFVKEFYQIEGYIGLPQAHRPNRTGQYLFINQRAVTSPLISFAVREGYGSALPNQRYPTFVLHLKMPGNVVDVNVHPQKKEVRLRNESILKEALIQAVQTVLQEQIQIEEAPCVYSLPTEEKERPWTATTPWVVAEAPISGYAPIREDVSLFDLKPAAPLPPRVIWTLQSYIIVEAASLAAYGFPCGGSAEGVYIVDQRAAHSRVYYEKLQKRSSQPLEIQTLLIPYQLDLTSWEAALVQEYMELFNQMGFIIQEFGKQAFKMDAIPYFVKKEDLKSYFITLLHDLKELHDTKRLQREKEKQLAIVACRAALPANRKLVKEEAEHLLKLLFKCEAPFQCPMGRPTLAYISPKNLQEYFQSY